MTDEPISGRGKLIIDSHNTADVDYVIGFVSDETGGQPLRFQGRVCHAEGHPHWNPITFDREGPFTLVTEDGRKLKVDWMIADGSVRGVAEPF